MYKYAWVSLMRMLQIHNSMFAMTRGAAEDRDSQGIKSGLHYVVNKYVKK